MQVDVLELGNFRNYDFERVEFHEKTNVLCGDNAQGKTNLLESVFLCGTTKSHRGSKDREMIRMGKEEAHVKVTLTKKGGAKHRIDIHIKKNKGKGIAIDGVPLSRSAELMGFLHVVFFSPEDLGIIKNGPAQRRKFLDMELCQLDGMYLHDLTEYNRTLMQKNKLLKQVAQNKSLTDTMDLWDEKLVEYGCRVIDRRKKFVQTIGEPFTQINGRLTGQKERVALNYEPDVKKEDYAKALRDSREKDLRFFSTTVGPHRDDLCFLNGDIDIRRYGSQGQQRTCALSLKLAEIALVRQMTGETPVLLLDDVLSELDRSRQNYLLDSISDIQTIITCTGIEEFLHSRLTLNRVFRVTNGKVETEKNWTDTRKGQ